MTATRAVTLIGCCRHVEQEDDARAGQELLVAPERAAPLVRAEPGEGVHEREPREPAQLGRAREQQTLVAGESVVAAAQLGGQRAAHVAAAQLAADGRRRRRLGRRRRRPDPVVLIQDDARFQHERQAHCLQPHDPGAEVDQSGAGDGRHQRLVVNQT